MDFKRQKQAVLGRKDKSLIGEIDPQIKDLVEALNSLEDYYTTSSCSGRIGLLHWIAKNKGMEWVFKSHSVLSQQEIRRLKEYFKTGEEVWFRQEPLILHVCCSSLESAQKLMAAAQKTGFKRPGIIAITRRIIVEIKNDNIINALVAGKGFLADDIQLGLLVKAANSKLLENFERIERLERAVAGMKNS